MDGRRSIPCKGKIYFSLIHSVLIGSETYSISSAMGTPPISFPGNNLPELEADHLPSSSTEIKNGGAIPLLPHMSP
jgi:hypothetical protein